MSTIQANGMRDSGGNIITFGEGGSSSASDVTYDNTTSHLTADDVQEAIDELAASAGSGGHTIKDSTTTFTQRDNLKFTGPGVSVTDDSSGNATVVNISGGGGSADLPRADYETSPATATHVIGDIVYYNDKAYDVTSAIAIGDSLVVSSGTTVGNISERAGNLSYEVFGLPGGGGGGGTSNPSVATYEEATALHNHEVGEYVYFNSIIYKVTSAITEGGTIAVGTNVALDPNLTGGEQFCIEGIPESGNMGDLLWINLSPESDFAETTLAINISGYRALKMYTKEGACEAYIVSGTTTQALVVTIWYDTNRQALAGYERVLSISASNEVTIGDAQALHTGNTANGRCIPYAIFGLV